MSVKAWIAVPIVLAVAVATSGCHFKSPSSFATATTKSDFREKVVGDKYSNGGIADASGGTKDGSQYGTGAKKGAGTVMNTERDQPAKGSGTMPGENPGTGHSNGPAYQGDPSNFQASTGGNRG